MGRFLFEIKEGLLISLKAIRANKARSILTTLGIVIGICSVALMSTAITGIDQAFESGISALGSDNLYIDKWEWFSDTEFWKVRNRRNLRLKEYNRFRDMVTLPAAVAPNILTRKKIYQGDKFVKDVLITGTTDEYVDTTNFDFQSGRFFTPVESKGARHVVVLGSDVGENLFDLENPVDRYVKIGGKRFKVVGVLTKQGSNLLGDFNPDRKVFVPIGTVFKHFVRASMRSIFIVLKARSMELLPQTIEEAEEAMRRVRGLRYDQENDFSINQQEGLTRQYNQTVGVIKIAGLFITGLALMVGAIGIMNIMFVSVKERTKEIGIRKAIGAKRRVILGQFLTESAIICLIGGLIGLGLAVLLSSAVNKVLPTSVQMNTVMMALIISVVTGVLSGLAPAYTAARMDPVEALGYE